VTSHSRDPRDETKAVRITATAGPTAAHETTGTSEDTNKSRDARICGNNISKRDDKASKDASNTWDASSTPLSNRNKRRKN
jgi:hypothetical protein